MRRWFIRPWYRAGGLDDSLGKQENAPTGAGAFSYSERREAMTTLAISPPGERVRASLTVIVPALSVAGTL
jgi:hypothetical protein